MNESNETHKELTVERPQWGNYWNMKNAGARRWLGSPSKLSRAEIIGDKYDWAKYSHGNAHGSSFGGAMGSRLSHGVRGLAG